MRSGVLVPALALVLVWSGAGCRREPAAPLPQETFVEVMVALRQAAQQSSGQADFEARKEVILKRARVTEVQLRAYARSAPRDPRALSTAYDSIAARLERFHEPE
jgi:hypothetical protein